MKAVYIQGEPGQVVHNSLLREDCGKFKIVEIYHEHLEHWDDFDADKNCPDTFISWKLDSVEQKKEHVLRRPEYALEKIIPDETLLNYQLHYINCSDCRTGCELSNDRVYMQWRELKELPAQETQKKTKKRKNEKNKKGVNKRLRLEGKAYKTKKGKEIPAVPPPEFVPCKCKNKCAINFPMEFRSLVYTQFWSIQSCDQRRQFIVNTVLPQQKKQVTVLEDSRKKWTWHYFLNKVSEEGASQQVEVCKNVYYKTLQVKEKFVRVAVATSTSGVAKPDQRGKKTPPNKKGPEDLKRIHDHLNMFPKVESHYARKRSKKQYISDTSNFKKLTVMKMYQLYKKLCVDDNALPVGYDTYLREFHKLNLAIYKPKKDQCKTCIAFQNKSNTEDEKREQEKHIKKKNEAYKVKDKFKDAAKKTQGWSASPLI